MLGHSSGGLIACYIASKSDLCNNLILEDPPLFSSVGEKRFNYYNYNDLSTICHNFINQEEEEDFVYYYVMNQYMWNFFLKIQGKKSEKNQENLHENIGKNILTNPWKSGFGLKNS